MKIIILGAGGHGQVAADIILAAQDNGEGFELLGYVDDDAGLHGKRLLDYPVLGPVKKLSEVKHDGIVIAIGDNATRQRFFETQAAMGEHFVTLCHPRATVARGTVIGKGSMLCAGAVVGVETVVGDNVILNTGCTVDHHNTIGDHVHIAPGANLGGCVTVGTGTLVGIGATVMPGISVGNWSTVGAAACVTRSVPNTETVKGVPARPE